MLHQFNIKEDTREVTFSRVLEEFESPILTEYKATTGPGLYIEKWCTRYQDVNRYLLVRSEQRAIAEYLAGKITMLRLLTDFSDGGGFIIDKKRGVKVDSFAVRLSELPASYLPKATAKHDESLRPEWDTIPQSFLINTDWDATLLALIEKRYLNLAGFAYFAKPGTGRKIPNIALGYDFEGGYTFKHAFDRIRGSIPTSQRARSVGVAAASPGVLTIDAPAEIVKQLERSFNSLSQSSVYYDALHSWAKLSPSRIDGMPANQQALDDIQALCNSLSISSDALFPRFVEGEEVDPKTKKEALLVAGKLVAAYYRRLWQILKPEPRVEFISSPTPSTSVTLPNNAVSEGDEDDL